MGTLGTCVSLGIDALEVAAHTVATTAVSVLTGSMYPTGAH